MAKIKKFEYKHSDGKIGLTQYHYTCPGCKGIHAIRLKSDGGCHDFNMDFDKPTTDLKTAGLLNLVGEVEPECIPAVCQFARIVTNYLKMQRIGANH